MQKCLLSMWLSSSAQVAEAFSQGAQLDVLEPGGANGFGLMAPPTPRLEWMRGTYPLCVIARMKSGVTLEQAQADLDRNGKATSALQGNAGRARNSRRPRACS